MKGLPVGGQAPDEKWLDAARVLRDDIMQGRFALDVEFLPSETLRARSNWRVCW